MKRIVLSTILAMSLSLILSLARAANWRLDAETGVLYDSNLSNSDRSSDVEDDWAWKTNLRLGNGFQLSRDLRLSLAADLHGLLWDHYHGFNEIGGGAVAALRYRFGLGRQAPWILLEERIGYDGFRESERNGWDETLQLRGGISLAERVALEAGYTLQNFAAIEEFWNLQGHRGDVRLLIELTSSLQVALGYSYRDGDIIAYAVPPRPDLVRLGPDRQPVSTFGTDPLYTAYPIRARTHAVSIFAAYAVSRHFFVQLAYEYAATSHDPLEYENHFVEAKAGFSY
jgi:hypothetical protein